MGKPNVLLINVDHWSASLMGCAGHNTIMTPTLDQLARDGVRFNNFFSTCPVCIPARRSLMTGMSPKSHGDRVYTDYLELPPVTTLAQAFRDNGYQAYAVGKLHVYPQRDRIGFDDVILCEEARYYLGAVDDYQTWLAEHGYLGREYAHAMGNNEYYTRPWHLPEEAHNTSWATAQMIKTIKRRNPNKPAFYYVSYIHPHPPLVPLQVYLDMYDDVEIPEPIVGDWVNDNCPLLKSVSALTGKYTPRDIARARKAFYAQCTHIDAQIRLIIGTLREEGMLENTIIGFTSDHGDMLFDHNLQAKRCFYQNSANVPFILSGKPLGEHAALGKENGSLGCLEDIYPTLMGLCGLETPDTVEGINLLTERRELLFGEITNGPSATRMATDGRFKLIYYPYGNVRQLFDLQNDPREMKNIINDAGCAEVLKKLTEYLIANLNGGDEVWARDGELVGLPVPPEKEFHNFGMSGQRGLHWPTPPIAKKRP